jgi:Zn-dependent alcohol dehydrogenase
VVNVDKLVKDEEELKLFAPMGCGFQTGAGAVTEMVNAGKKDTIVVGIILRGNELDYNVDAQL